MELERPPLQERSIRRVPSRVARQKNSPDYQRASSQRLNDIHQPPPSGVQLMKMPPAYVVDPYGLTHVLDDPHGNKTVRETLCRDHVFRVGDENYTPQTELDRRALVCTWCRTFAGYKVHESLTRTQGGFNV